MWEKKSPCTETGAFRRSRAGRSTQGEENERYDKGSRPSVPPAARKRGHDTRDDQTFKRGRRSLGERRGSSIALALLVSISAARIDATHGGRQ
jgi:hypothetical protein